MAVTIVERKPLKGMPESWRRWAVVKDGKQLGVHETMAKAQAHKQAVEMQERKP
jgi:hypothetical protein